MTPGLAPLLAYSVQIAIVVLVAQLAVGASRVSLPSVRLAYWRGVGLTCLALPFLPVIPSDHFTATVAFGIASTPLMAFEPSSAPQTTTVGTVLMTVLAAGLVIRLVLLAFGLVRLRQMRRESVPVNLNAALSALRDDLAPDAELRWSDRIEQPVAFGVVSPVVLLPRRFAELDEAAQQGVACHELTHIARHDWAWIVSEEIVRAIFWFHPAIAWVLSQVHLNREQVVDDLVVRRTGARNAYMCALLTFADAPPIGAPAVALLRRHHLAARIERLSKEVSMSRTRALRALCLLSLIHI